MSNTRGGGRRRPKTSTGRQGGWRRPPSGAPSGRPQNTAITSRVDVFGTYQSRSAMSFVLSQVGSRLVLKVFFCFAHTHAVLQTNCCTAAFTSHLYTRNFLHLDYRTRNASRVQPSQTGNHTHIYTHEARTTARQPKRTVYSARPLSSTSLSIASPRSPFSNVGTFRLDVLIFSQEEHGSK